MFLLMILDARTGVFYASKIWSYNVTLRLKNKYKVMTNELFFCYNGNFCNKFVSSFEKSIGKL